ncbi:MAG: hypothetical protein OXT06_28960, partial [Rhodospirillaceae bacterium]|nr:hypothetical protein [Rhodospirillaceae bacterium]
PQTLNSGGTTGLEATSNLSTTISSLTNNGTTFVNSGGTFTITDVTNEAGTFRLEAYDVNTPLSLNDLVVNGGTVTHGNNSTAQTHIVNISAANINVGASGSINVDELGYDGGPDYTDGEGPGAGQGAGGFVTVGGGAHGGDGGDGTEVGGTAYCTISDVDTIGSGGGGGSSGGVGGNGGGLIELNVSDTLTVNGTITANGGDGSAGYAGGGAGGGIKINTVTWAGTPAGNIAADGGDGAGDGGGGGGCIQIVYSTSSISSGDLSVAGGSGADNGSVGLTSYSLSNTAPTVSTALATTGQNTDGTGLYNFTFSVDDDDDDTLSVQVECGDSSYADIDIYSAGGGGSSFDNNAATYQITGINTSSGAVDMTLQVATQSTIDDTDTSNFQCRVTPYDGTSTGTASALTGLSLDNLDPSASNDASFSIVSDADSNGIANIGDTIRLNAGTESTGDTVTWSFVSTGVTGEASLTAGTESSAIIAGSFDLAADTPININVADDSGNSVTAQTATSPVLDNQPPSFSSNGTLSLSTDLNSDGIAGIGDKVTLSGATVSSSDSDSFTINLSALTGDSSVSMGSPSTVASGSQSGSQTYTITATDNAGNTATTASDAITVYNFARTVGFSAATSSVSEGGGTATITLSLDSASGANTTINYSVGGTATSGFDYIAPSGSATILAGNTSTTITITIGADTDVEDTETIALSITGATGATASGTTTHTLSIIDDDTESSSSNGGGSSGGNSGGGDSSSDSSSDSSGDSESSDSSSEEASDSDDTDGESSEESEEDSEDEDDEPVEVPAFLDDAEDDEDEDDSPSDFSNDDDLRGSADEDSSDDEESSEEDNVNSDTNTSNLILDIFN